MTITITDEFREKVNKAARSVAGRNSSVDWQDIAQDVWVRMLEDVSYYHELCEQEDPFPSLKKVAKQEMYKANSAWEYFSGQYTYTPGEVRGLLSEYLIDVELEAIAEHVDLVEGLLLLKESNKNQFNVIVNKWVHGVEGNTGRTTEAVDKLAQMMNQVNRAARYSYEGPGSRRVMSNSQAQARTE